MKRGVALLAIVAIGVLLIVACSPEKPDEDAAKEKKSLQEGNSQVPPGGTNPTAAGTGCGDNAINGAETDLNCGGAGGCPKCANGKTCKTGTDCISTKCNADNKCTA